MSARRKLAWPVFLAASATGFLALAILTFYAQLSARRHNIATAESQRQEDLRTAIYRMEQRMAPLFSRILGRLESSANARESITLRIDLESERAVPLKVPLEAPTELLAQASRSQIAGITEEPPDLPPPWIIDNSSLGSNFAQVEARGKPRTDYEYQHRLNAQTLQNVNRDWTDPGSIATGGTKARIEIGPITAGWKGGPVDELVLVRDILIDDQHVVQTLWVDWSELRALLLGEIDDLFTDAKLEPVLTTDVEARQSVAQSILDGDLLVTIPARLTVPRLAKIKGGDQALLLTSLATWSLALLAFAAASLAFRASQRDAHRQRRFTSAVTHELRTPLTTFRMYSEMLARNMVPEERKGEYLQALEEESRRLGCLVENVLAHARLEDGANRSPREEVSVQDLLTKSQTVLFRRCEEVGTELLIDIAQAGNARLSTDPESVALILSNLVDNACKYGAPKAGHSPDSPIRLHAIASEREVVLSVSDPGSGIPRGSEALIFNPFERAGRDESDGSGGVGLGLALARDLARELGGELSFNRNESPGACFELRLPIVVC